MNTCTCVTCAECRGMGTIRIDDKTQPSGWDLDTCNECNGSGITEMCDYCHDAWERDHDEEDAHEH